MTSALHTTPVAILAGGIATRLRPLSEKIPKSLFPVAGKPFLAHQLNLLRAQGIPRAVLCVGHLGELIEKEFGNGEAYGIHLDYRYDGPRLLGTGGALKQALPLLGDAFFVLYGDSYLTAPFAPMKESFERSGKSGLMTVYRNQDLHDTSNIVFRDGAIVHYDKTGHEPGMEYIDYGLSLFRPKAFDMFPAGEPFDLMEVMQNLIAQGDMAAYEVAERFYETGSFKGLAELEAKLGQAPEPEVKI